ncbi:MAG: VIT domain-containing protein [Myxococcota bacterium]
MGAGSRILLLSAVVVGASCTQVGPEPKADVRVETAELTEIDGPAEAPLSLTATDGTGLELVALDVKSAVQAPLALTELRLTFENPLDRVIAGQFTIDLPAGAGLSRFAMKIDGHWQEGEVLEKQRAREIYDDFLHRRVDPALLQKQAGNRFSAKVFPIPARGRKELIISYTETLEGPQAPYRLPLRGLPKLGSFDVQVHVDEPDGSGGLSRRVVERHEQAFEPRGDLLVRTEGTPPTVALRGDAGVLVRTVVPGTATEADLTAITIAFDSSASRSAGYGARVRHLSDVMASLADVQPDLPVRVVAFDQSVDTVFEGTARSFGPPAVEALLGRRALGASNVEELFTALAEGPALSRLVVFSDGVATAGDRTLAGLREGLEALGERGLQRMDAVVDSRGGDTALMKALVTDVLPQPGAIARDDHAAATILRRLRRPMLADITPKVEGAERIWPASFNGVQPGDAVLLYAMDAPKGPIAVDFSGGHEDTVTVDPVKVPGPLINRALATAKIEALTLDHGAAEDEKDKAWLAEQITTQSKKWRIVSDFTAMLVLETDADYERYDIDRDATLDILTVGDDGATIVGASRKKTEHDDDEAGGDGRRRKSGLYARRGPEDGEGRMAGQGSNAGILGMMQQESGHFLASPYGGAFAVGNDDEDVWGGLTGSEVGEAFGVGGLGLVGSGGGGGGTASGGLGLGLSNGYGSFSRGRRVPTVRIERVRASKGLDGDIVRRIIRAHINEVRHCYNQVLDARPNARANVKLTLSISAEGRVVTTDSGTARGLPRSAHRCIESAVKRWKFPKPRGGVRVDATGTLTLRPLAPRHRRSRRSIGQRPPTYGVRDTRQSLAAIDAENVSPYTGRMKTVMDALSRGDTAAALDAASAWQRESPTDLVALLALGEALTAVGRRDDAARAYGSIIDLHSTDAPMLRYASARLTALRGYDALALDAAREARRQRPDHPSSHRTLAYALASTGAYEEALDVLSEGKQQRYASQYLEVQKILGDDGGIIGALWLDAEPSKKAAITAAIDDAGFTVAKGSATHFVLSWETDANDVDLHVYDGKGYHSDYRVRGLKSGGHLYADVTDGYGPESFTIAKKPTAYPYRIDVDYYRQGPMGYGLGSVQVIDRTDGVSMTLVPFILMNADGRVRVHTVQAPLSKRVPG